MNPRPTLYHWIAHHGLDADQGRELLALAGLREPPARLLPRFWAGIALVAAGLGGLGLILWIAANWNELGRLARFALLQGVLVVLCIGAALRPRARPALGLLSLLAIGGLFACLGQTYQTGADPWQLFALWAALALPLALAVRSDWVWAPWTLVAGVAIALWLHTQTGHRWRVEPEDLVAYAIAWVASGALVALLAPWLARFTGAGPWALRSAGMLAVLGLVTSGVAGLFHRHVAPHYPLALALLALAGALLCTRRAFEVFLLSAVALALDVLLVGGLARWLFLGGPGGDAIGHLLLLGLAAAGLLAASVSLILRLARRAAP